MSVSAPLFLLSHMQVSFKLYFQVILAVFGLKHCVDVLQYLSRSSNKLDLILHNFTLNLEQIRRSGDCHSPRDVKETN